MKHVLLRPLPGRAIVLGTAVKIAVFVLRLFVAAPSFVGVIDTVASSSKCAETPPSPMAIVSRTLSRTFDASSRWCEM